MAINLGDASELFSRNKLLIESGLTNRLNQFFNRAFCAAQTLQLAENPMTENGNTRAGFFDEARAIAFKELPALLEGIETDARSVIHT
jgi:hypothetical protein